MRTIRFRHLPSGSRLLVAVAPGKVYGVGPAAATIAREDEARESFGGSSCQDLLAAARSFEALWKWPAPGTRFPPRAALATPFPEAWFSELGGRLNQCGEEGDLEFRGYLDAREAARLARGEPIAAERTALEQHLMALDYRLTGELGLRDLYRAFRVHGLTATSALKKALGAFLSFGRGRPVPIARIAERRPSARTGGYDAAGEVNPEILGQYRRLFATASTAEIEQARLADFNRRNFPSGLVSREQWKTFFATCTALNQRETVTYAQLVRLFDGSLSHLAASKVDATGRRPLDRVVAD